MLPVKKEETELTATDAPAAGAFGKVLGSIQGLQQRLSDFSYGEVSIAEAKVKLLVEQLVLLRENLNNLAQLKQAVSETNQRVSAIPAENFDQVNLANLEKHPQLHSLVQASKLMPVQRLMKAGCDGVAESKQETAHPSEEIALAHDHRLTNSVSAVIALVDDPTTAISGIAPAQPVDTLTAEQTPGSLSAPSSEVPPAKVDRLDSAPGDWTFDFDEVSASAVESVNFVFPPDTLSVPEKLTRVALTVIAPPPGSSVTEAAITAPHRGPNIVDEKEPVAARHRSPNNDPRADKAEAKLEESKALVPANHDLDQRLLDDVIKNYGDFAITANLPAIVEAPNQIKPMDHPSTAKTEPRFGKPIAEKRKFPQAQRNRDLDRQLKKIIKDYGENDLYQRQSVVNLKTAGIAAFAVLGLVLGALYLFNAPETATPVQTRSAAQPQAAERADSAEAATPDKSAGVKASLAGPDAANASTSPLTDTKQIP